MNSCTVRYNTIKLFFSFPLHSILHKVTCKLGMVLLQAFYSLVEGAFFHWGSDENL